MYIKHDKNKTILPQSTQNQNQKSYIQFSRVLILVHVLKREKIVYNFRTCGNVHSNARDFPA